MSDDQDTPFSRGLEREIARLREDYRNACDRAERAEDMARIEALEYVAALCRSSEQLTFYSEAYRGAFRDMRVSVQASIERLKRGERMQSTSDLMGSAAAMPIEKTCTKCGHKESAHDWGDGSCSDRKCACRDFIAAA